MFDQLHPRIFPISSLPPATYNPALWSERAKQLEIARLLSFAAYLEIN
jgi:hypothetical protein